VKEKEKEKKKNRFNSPFLSRKPDKQKSRGNIQKPADTIPGFLPKESLLVGGDSNSIRALSKGGEGDVLSVRDGCLTWSEPDASVPKRSEVGDVLFMSADGMRWVSFRDAVGAHVRLAIKSELEARNIN
jgi:hypothetical protein